jgi:NTP pyrophosphatase (non-canonical NTP hydrolase)
MTREQHLLTVLAEECAEVAQRAAKAVRFGMAEVQPGQDADNRARLEAELGDLMGMLDMLDLVPDEERRREKPTRVEHYLGYSESLGQVKGG